MGKNVQGFQYWIIEMNGTLTSPDGKSVNSATGTYTRVWTAGAATPNYLEDDQYNISCYGVFTASTGLKYNFKTDQSIIANTNCGWINMGIVELIPIGGIARLLDYGNGACDDKAVLTVNNATYELKMD